MLEIQIDAEIKTLKTSSIPIPKNVYSLCLIYKLCNIYIYIYPLVYLNTLTVNLASTYTYT